MLDYDKEAQAAEGLGISHYRLTEITLPVIDRPPSNYAEDIKTNADMVLDVLDWVWQEFEIDGGRSFLDSVISPLGGNYKSIRANGEAWRAVGELLGEVAANIGANAKVLADEHWKGEAADLFGQFLEVYWKKGAALAGAKVGEFLAKGFDKVADLAIEVVEEAVRAINVIIGVAKRLAGRGIPIIGQAWTVVKELLDLFGVEMQTILDDINDIRNAWIKVQTLYARIEEFAASIESYFMAVNDIIEAVRRIPHIDTVADAYAIKETISEGRGAMKQHAGEIDKDLTDADRTLERLDGRAKDKADK